MKHESRFTTTAFFPVIVIENSLFLHTVNNFFGTNIVGLSLGLVIMSSGKMCSVTRNHELIHSEQMLETAFVGFFFIYIFDYLYGRWRGLDHYHAYRAIRAEIEAFSNERKWTYLSKRKRWRWLIVRS
jgi:hypothetical protein